MNFYKNLFILNYYSIENYLFHPDNLEEFFKLTGKDFDRKNYIDEIKNERPIIRDKILLGIAGARSGYPFYRENDADVKLKDFKSNAAGVLKMFDSDNFETFYKVFPAKDYGTQLKERQNLNPADLAKTKWFKDKIVEALIK